MPPRIDASRWSRVRVSLLSAALIVVLPTMAAQPSWAAQSEFPNEKPSQSTTGPVTPDQTTQFEDLRQAVVRLPLATALACVLAMRPRRRGTPSRRPAVIHTQIILAVIGAIVMLVVGSSLARAFGIVGAAGLVRYRAKVEDPKDAGVMLSTLAIGLACGVGLWLLAIFGTAFILAVLWSVESFEPTATRLFALTIKSKDSSKLQPPVERELSKAHAPFELRGVSPDALHYEVRWPLERTTDRLVKRLLALGPERSIEIEWEQKSEKKS
jgi:hypothetical protein